ncbi:MAG: hypothetical protein ACI4K7_10915 [Oscillospiraceae bacterium]
MELNDRIEDVSEENEKKGFFDNIHFGAGNMVLCAGISAASSLLGMDGLFSEGTMLPLRAAALILMLVNWLFSAYLGGKDGRAVFAVFSLCYWIVPTVIYIACGFSVSNAAAVPLIGELGGMLTIYPFSFAARATGLPEWFFSAVMLIAVLAVHKFTSSYYSD